MGRRKRSGNGGLDRGLLLIILKIAGARLVKADRFPVIDLMLPFFYPGGTLEGHCDLDLLADTAIKETKKNGVFVIPRLGRLVKAERKARLGWNLQTGKAINIVAKPTLRFRAAKSAKDASALKGKKD